MNKPFLVYTNRVLIGLIVLCILFFGYALFHAPQTLSLEPSRTHDRSASSIEPIQTVQDREAYVKLVSSRILFRPLTEEKKEKTYIKTIDDVLKDYVLVGIVSVGKKEAIIKNRRTRQTYFVTVGSRFGELHVLAIGDEKIDVQYKDETKSLFLQ